jgi:hypothetical protein
MNRDGVKNMKELIKKKMFVKDVRIKLKKRNVGVKGGDEKKRIK